jgi:cysteinyl-tRNA synthetase
MRLYNTLSRQLEELPPPPGPIGMYVCGPTVYQRAHIGNARPFVIFSWLRNWLRSQGYEVTFVHNITDVNDKIYEAAPGKSAELARQGTEWYVEDIRDLGLGLPDEVPKATETIPEIVAMIGRLVADRFAYEVEGDVYFSVSRYPEYGQLSRQRPDEMQDEEPSALKQDPRDFALWKATKPGEDTWWDSPWGRGRPGWHIECSAMAEKFLGPSFEIHGAGIDIVFPHNENELAQSRALGSRFARIWMHNGMLRFTGEKMSKSLGNVTTIREAVDTWGRETVLLFFLTAHWSKPIDFSEETLAQATAQVETLRNKLRYPSEAGGDWDELVEALDDDFSTPAALSLLHRWRDRDLLVRALRVFGLESLAGEEAAPSELVARAVEREQARKARDFAEADRLRAEIEAHGWEVRDEDAGFRLVRRA